MEEGVRSVVFRVGYNPADPTCNSDLALGFVQVNLLLVREAFRAVICDDGSAAGVIRPPGLYIP